MSMWHCEKCLGTPGFGVGCVCPRNDQTAASVEPSDEELAQVWRQVSGRETLRPDSVAMKFARALLSRYGRGNVEHCSGDAQPVAWEINDKGLGHKYITYSARTAKNLSDDPNATVRPLIYGSARPRRNNMTPIKFNEFSVIVKNSAKCLLCNQEIESKHVHDFVTCSCGMLSVDGGKDYLKRCFKEFDGFIDTSETRYMSLDEIENQRQRWLSLSKSEFGKYYANKVKLAEEYINYLKYGDEND